jgi:hypothetical protein
MLGLRLNDEDRRHAERRRVTGLLADARHADNDN